MLPRNVDSPLEVQVPGKGADRPSWTKVGVLTALGFAVGLAWPRLAGVRAGPSLPEAASAPAAAGCAGPLEPSAPSSAVPAVVVPAAAAAPSSPAAVAVPSDGPIVTVGHGAVLSCRTASNSLLKANECGSVPVLDALLMTRLRKLADCPQAVAATGKLHVVLHVDFARNSVGAELGRGQGISPAEPLLACARSAVAAAGLAGVPHDNPRYSIAYSVTLAAKPVDDPASGAATSGANGDAPEGTAQVVWDVAVVRDAPKTGQVVARLQRGTALHVGAARDGWYPVKYGEGLANDGWVYRAAIGK